MPQRSAVSQLPEGIRKALEQRLLQGGFADYAGLAEWLSEQGYAISRSSVHRFGQHFESRLQALKTATDQAKAIAHASKDDEGDMNEALIRLVQTKTFEVLVALDEGDGEDGADVDLAKIGRMVAELARASISQKKWSTQVRERMDAKFAALEQEADGTKGTLDKATLARVREEVYGLI